MRSAERFLGNWWLTDAELLVSIAAERWDHVDATDATYRLVEGLDNIGAGRSVTKDVGPNGAWPRGVKGRVGAGT